MHEFLRTNPFIKILIPFTFGIISQIKFEYISFNLLPVLSIFTLIIISTSFLKPIKQKVYNQWIIGLPLYILIFLLGAFVVFEKQFNPEKHSPLTPHDLTIARITESPELKDKSVKLITEVYQYNSDDKNIDKGIECLIYIERDSLSKLLKLGDIIVLESEIKQVEGPKNPMAFNYKKFLKYKGIHYTAYVGSGSWIFAGRSDISLVSSIAHTLQENLISVYKRHNISGDEFGVLAALTLGYKNELDKELMGSFSASGAMHVLAVSGLHVGIIYLVLISLLNFIKKYKYGSLIRAALIVIFLWLFALMTGLSPSVLRSATMFSFIIIGQSLNREISVYNSLAASAFFILCFNPYQIMQTGFQLSYLAVISIVFFQPRIYSLFYLKSYLPDKLWALTSVSIAAQIGTFPLGLYYFNQFPNYFLLTNLIVIPLAAVILYLAIALIILSFIPVLSDIIGWLLEITVYFLNESVKWIESIPYSTIKNVYISTPMLLLLYVLITSFTLYLIKKRKLYLFLNLLVIISILWVHLMHQFSVRNKDQLVLYHTPGFISINYLSSEENLLVHPNEQKPDSKIISFNLQPYWNYRAAVDYKIIRAEQRYENGKLSITNNFFKAGNMSFYHLFNNELIEFYYTEELQVDYLIVSGDSKIQPEDLIGIIDYKNVILDASTRYYTCKLWEDSCEKANISCYSIRENGALILDL